MSPQNRTIIEIDSMVETIDNSIELLTCVVGSDNTFRKALEQESEELVPYWRKKGLPKLR